MEASDMHQPRHNPKLGRDLLYFSRRSVEAVGVAMAEVMEAVELAFRERGEGRVEMPPKPGLHPRGDAFIHAMPAFVPAARAAGIKWIGGYPENLALYGLPYITGLLILNDPETGVPLAVMDATWITAKRTGAVSGLSAKLLARPDSRVLAIFGCGVQARTQLEALVTVLPGLEEVRCFDIVPENLERFMRDAEGIVAVAIASEASGRAGATGITGQVGPAGNHTGTSGTGGGAPQTARSALLQAPGQAPRQAPRPYPRPAPRLVAARSAEEAAVGADVLVSAGPILKHPSPTLQAVWLKEGTLGLPIDFDSFWSGAALRASDRYYVDDRVQYAYYKESQGYFAGAPEVLGDLGDLVTGKAPGRQSDRERIVAMNLGLAMEDVVTARLVYDRAVERGVGEVLGL